MLVTEKQSELIVLVQKVAKLRLVMRGESDEESDSEEFTDYRDFYNSVFGSAQSGNDADGEPAENDRETFTTKIWGSTGYQEVQFVGNKRITATEPPSFVTDDNDDSEDYDRSEEIESGLEEDQYPGE